MLLPYTCGCRPCCVQAQDPAECLLAASSLTSAVMSAMLEAAVEGSATGDNLLLHTLRGWRRTSPGAAHSKAGQQYSAWLSTARWFRHAWGPTHPSMVGTRRLRRKPARTRGLYARAAGKCHLPPHPWSLSRVRSSQQRVCTCVCRSIRMLSVLVLRCRPGSSSIITSIEPYLATTPPTDA